MNNRTIQLIPYFLLLFATSAWGGIYTWTDAEGNVHFSDKKPQQADVKRVESKHKLNTYTAGVTPALTNSQQRPVVKKPLKLKQGHVRMYTTEWCSYCKKAKRYFNNKGIRFSEHDIEKSKQAQQEYQSMGGGGVPLILIGHRQGNKVLSGFTVASFEAQYRQ